MNSETPWTWTKTGSPLLVISSLLLLAIVVTLAATAPYAWYWRSGIFLGGLLFLWVIYPGVRMAVLGSRSKTKPPTEA
jgi:hypothetical protein